MASSLVRAYSGASLVSSCKTYIECMGIHAKHGWY